MNLFGCIIRHSVRRIADKKHKGRLVMETVKADLSFKTPKTASRYLNGRVVESVTLVNITQLTKKSECENLINLLESIKTSLAK